MATDRQGVLNVRPKSPYPRGCSLCAGFETYIAVRRAQKDEGEQWWRDAYAEHIRIEHRTT